MTSFIENLALASLWGRYQLQISISKKFWWTPTRMPNLVSHVILVWELERGEALCRLFPRVKCVNWWNSLSKIWLTTWLTLVSRLFPGQFVLAVQERVRNCVPPPHSSVQSLQLDQVVQPLRFKRIYCLKSTYCRWIAVYKQSTITFKLTLSYFAWEEKNTLLRTSLRYFEWIFV